LIIRYKQKGGEECANGWLRYTTEEMVLCSLISQKKNTLNTEYSYVNTTHVRLLAVQKQVEYCCIMYTPVTTTYTSIIISKDLFLFIIYRNRRIMGKHTLRGSDNETVSVVVVDNDVDFSFLPEAVSVSAVVVAGTL